ncbi:MAG: EAL and GGDEF domain-containing protein [Spirochaetaceae bacterium]|nr:EAL and GGDEF domain-containing protein [Spirochaetaceae bacterium]MCF7949403.1 EAL and GGDEF domain-containing protein [Spirochaetia bacterium]MCF7952094.1 EAL and GGDEF domain-containing protein [Spirochaetaceae bacterium]
MSNFRHFDLHLSASDFGGDPQDDAYLHFVDMLNHNRIRSYSQPIVDLYTGEVFGYELLARGENPFFSPAQLFERAKEWDLEWEVEYACRIAALKQVAASAEDFPLANFFINISPAAFSHPDFQSDFSMTRLQEYGISGERLVLEITETVSVDDYPQFESTIRNYVQQGFRIALDDFGSGHSGLITLAASTPHILKIDKDLVRGIHRSSYKQNLVKSITDFAESVGSFILLEGIETTEELRTAYRLGARYAQGYYLGRPHPKPQLLSQDIKGSLKKLMDEYIRKDYVVDVSIYKMVTRPTTFEPHSVNGAQLNDFFRSQNSIDHVVIVDKDDKPTGLITQQSFYEHLSGRYGYAIFQRKEIDALANQEMLLIHEDTDIRILGKMAMNRHTKDLYDPVVVIDNDGTLVGTITMKMVISHAFDTEVKFAASANPLTSLPGNVVINVWLEELLHREEYSIAYIDLDRFKGYNDHYGFSAGDDMIRLVAEILSEQIQTISFECRLGHIGGDDFVLLSEGVLTEEFFERICRAFDERRENLCSVEDVQRNGYYSSNRKGEQEFVPLITLSIAVVTQNNFLRPPHPGKLGQSVALLKSKAKEINYVHQKSGFLFERRIYEEELEN